MRRNSSDENARLLIESLTSPPTSVIGNGKNNVGDLIYRFEKPDAMRELIGTSAPSRPLVHSQISGGGVGSMLYYNGKNAMNPVFVPDMKLSDLQYLHYLQQQQQSIDKLRLRKPVTGISSDSMLSLTDSEFYSDDQQQDFVGGSSVGGRGGYDDEVMFNGMFRDQKQHHQRVVHELSRFSRFIEIMSRLPLPRMTFTGMGFCFLLAVFICPRACDENLLFPAFRLLFGTLYPAYASYKAVRTKNVKEYVKWMMYWIVYAFFTCIETFTDIFLSWFPFYYEIKVLIVLWLLSPATKGSSTLYRKFVHPMLTRREPEIDEYINQAKEKGYTAVLQLGSKGVNYATNVIMQTALKGGGNLVQTIRRSYSLSDLSEPDDQRTQDEIDEVGRPQRLLRPRSQTARSSSGGRNVDMYFSEVDVASKTPQPNFNYVRSSDDISSGYSSAEPISSSGLSRTASLTNAAKPRFKAKRVEDDVYLESDECEALPEVRHDPLNYSSYVSNPCNPNYPMPSRLTTRPQRPHSDIIADWKMQAFFDNQKYFQDVVLESLKNNQPPDSDVIDAGNQSTENVGHPAGNNDTMKGKPLLAQESKNSAKMVDIDPSKFQSLMQGNSSKYELFCKWLEENEKIATEKAAGESNPTLMKRSKQMSEDEFKDTISASSEDEFHDTDNSIIMTHVQDLSNNKPQLLETLKESELSKSISLDVVDNETPLPSILDDYNASRSSSSDGKRPASHHKGKAPNPPSITATIDTNATENVEKYPANLPGPIDLPETVSDLNELSTKDDQQRSRSPSPRSDSKSRSAKASSLFKSYLPSIFRSQSPKPTASEQHDTEDDNNKETQI